MDKLMFNGVNVLNPLEGKIQEVIEYFVAFYGEKYRERITQKINNTTFIFAPKDEGNFNRENLALKINACIKNQFEKIFYEMAIKHDVDLFEENGEAIPITRIARTRYNLASGQPLNLGEKAVYTTFKESSGGLLNDQAIIDLIDKFLIEYSKVVEPKIKELEAERDIILNAYEKAFSGAQKIKKQAKIDIRELMEIYFYGVFAKGQRPSTEGNIDASNSFVARADAKQLEVFCELVKQESFPSILTQSQQEKYIKFFKYIGFDHGDVYKRYTEDEKLQKLVFNGTLMESIMFVEEAMEDDIKRLNQFYTNAEDIVNAIDIKYETNRDDLLYALEEFMFGDKVNGMAVSYLDQDNQLKAVCFCEDYFNLATSTLIHELNHIVQECLIGENSSAFYTKTGFDIIPFEKEDGSLFYEINLTSAGNRPFEMLNEIINEYLSLRIFESMRLDGVKIGIGKEIVSAYYDGFYVFDKFIKENLEAIVDNCFSADKRALGAVIGDTEFKRLAEIAEDVICSEYFDLNSAISEIARVLKIDVKQYEEFDNVENLAGGHEWSKNARKYLTYVERTNKLGRKLSECTNQNDNARETN